MKISHNWLQQFIKTDLSTEEISIMLTDLGLEVEGMYSYESIKGGLQGVVVGEVLSCEPHPNADRLKKTEVLLGENEIVPIVCGAPNVAKGQKVLVATVGTLLTFHDGTEVKISKSKIRGEVSMGMICAEDELGLGSNHDGILVLDHNKIPGTPAASIFEVEIDTVYEIGLTPNRADAMSHLGVARDLKALCTLRNIPFEWSVPETSSFHVDTTQKTIPVEIEDSEKCLQYHGLTLTNIKISPSPQWLQNRLKAIGINPKNNIVDVTNYVMHELGQPLHAFDADKINEKIVVKTFPKNTSFITLEGTERKLTDEDLMIGDTKEPHCIAGVFGGIHSGVDEQTNSVFLESAYFNPVSIRKTAKYHGLNTDASFRFERGIDPEIGIYALKRAAILIKQLSGGEISSNIQEFSRPLEEPKQIFLSYEKIEKTIGQSLEKEELYTILNGLEIGIVIVTEAGIGMSIPRYRVDVTRPADVIEEILRVYGYNRLEEKPLVFEANPPYQWKSIHKIENEVASKLSSFGFFETLNNSLSSPEFTADFHQAVTLVNPLGKELSKMRQTLLYQALEVVSFNLNRQNKQLKLYEFGSIYGKSGDAFIEAKRLSLSVSGEVFNSHWELNSQPDPFYYFKGILSDLFKSLGYSEPNFEETVASHFDLAFSLEINAKKYGHFGIVSSTLRNQFGIDQEVYFAELNWEELTKHAFSKPIIYEEVAKFPLMRRDFALLIDKNVSFQSLKDTAYKTERKILQDVNLFDVYEGKNLPKDKKSYGISFTFQDKNKTLTDKQVERVMEQLLQNFKSQFGAELR
ncbi:MAG: phenylalanine--tRNA ligase subunit beta [Bacteroidetes bacterium]|nr:phenylalanine--tRNA ligase subunit beta [Bacteroidota bacterium]MDA0984655.1 phenylalanine--tRNA ligase subunit beta [Bacteroidota bacterium]